MLMFGLCSSNIISQNCIEYPEIEGPFCSSCAPEGWVVQSSSPDLLDPTSFPCMTSESPSGGNVIHLFSNGSTDIESISSEFEIPGFIDGNEYYFGMYMMACGAHPVVILLTIDGEDYEIASETEWEYIELCLTPESASIEIFITVEDYADGMITNTLIDSGVCDETYCCSLTAELEEEFIALCPGEEQIIEGEYSGETGSVNIEWTSEPSYGVNYLDNPESMNPTISIPENNDFEGETIIYTVTIEDSDCDITREFELEILTSEKPEFEILLCELYEDYELPLVSLNGYSGTWEGDFDFDELVNEVHEYTFTLDSGQDNCIQEWTFEYLIHPEELITFDYQTIYCVNDDDTYHFPERTEERVEGVWDEDKFTPDELGVGTHKFTFYPNRNEYCTRDYVMIIEVIGEQGINFDIDSSFCVQADTLYLPDTSIEGIMGVWNESFIDLNIETESQTVIFSSLDDEDCYEDYQHSYSVLSKLENTFDIPDTICRSMEYIEFDSMSNEGNLGFWTPLAVSMDTILEDNFQVYWTPLDFDEECISGSSFVIQLVDEITVEFNLPNLICTNSGVLQLPVVSDNNISGAWNISEINTDIEGAGIIDLIFTPEDERCFINFTHSVEIIDADLSIIEFDIQTVFCAMESEFVLPKVSTNGVIGSWSQESLNPNDIQDSLVLVFYPEISDLSCFQATEVTFYIEPLINLTFDLPDSFCSTSGSFLFPVESNDGVSGTWLIEEFDPEIHGQSNTFQNHFIPDEGDCYMDFNIEVDVYTLSEIGLNTSDATSCAINNGSYELVNALGDLELSIDGGLNWSQEFFRNNLSSGIYELQVRYIGTDCIEYLEFEIFAPSSVNIIELQIDSIKDCSKFTSDLTCIVDNTNSEYSIDDGNTWQSNNLFTDLSPGDYTLIIRSTEAEDCSDTTSFTIFDFEQTIISDIQFADVSDCNSIDGEIVIEASGVNLEYSIDGGLNWQQSNEFINLEGGTFSVHVRSQVANDCIDTDEIEITSPEFPEITMLIVDNLTSCNESNGRIEIQATNLEIEYSIDGGQTWQLSNQFDGLVQGQYDVRIRMLNALNCEDSETVRISSPEAPIIEMLDVSDVSSCVEDNGRVEILSTGIDLEFSIDGGQTWSMINLFDNLPAGEYTVIVRASRALDCIVSEEIEIKAPEELEIVDGIFYDASSCNTSDASIELILNSLDVEYSIDGGQEWQANGIFTDLAEGAYSVIVRKISMPDCELIYKFDIFDPPCPCRQLVIVFEVEPVDCLNPLSGSITIESIEGNIIQGDYQVIWENGTNDLHIENLSEGWQNYTIEYDRNCQMNDSVYIDSFDPISFNLLSFDQNCSELGSIEVINFMGGAGEARYSIDGLNFQDNAIFTNLTAQEYQVLVEDLFNCNGKETTEVNDASDLQLDILGIDPIEFGESTFLNPLINEMTIDSFVWYPSNGILNLGELIAHVSPLETISYTLTIYFGDCVETRSVTVEVIEKPNVYLGDIFTPNDDGNNDFFKVQSKEDLDIAIHSFRVFDRWGNKVFENLNFKANDDTEAWDGRYNEKEVIQGVYVYVLSYSYRGEEKSKSGTVTVLR